MPKPKLHNSKLRVLSYQNQIIHVFNKVGGRDVTLVLRCRDIFGSRHHRAFKVREEEVKMVGYYK